MILNMRGFLRSPKRPISQFFFALFVLAFFSLLIKLCNSYFLANILERGLDNDHLIVADHFLLLFNGKLSLNSLVFSRLPSIFPDYPIGFLALLFSHKPITYLALHGFIQLFLILFSLTFLVSSISRVSILYASFVQCLLLLVLSALSGVSFSIIISALPVNHGGNAFNVVTATALLFFLLSRNIHTFTVSNRVRIFFYYALLIVSIFSNRFFLTQFLIPAVIFTFLNPSTRLTLRKNFFFIVLIAGSAVISSNLLIVRQCADPTLQFGGDLINLIESKLTMLFESGVAFVLLCPIPCCFMFRIFKSNNSMYSYSLFASISSSLSLLLYLLLAPNAQLLYLRYLLGPIFLAIAFLSVLAINALKISSQLVSTLALSGLTAFAAISLDAGISKTQSQPTANERHDWAISQIQQFGLGDVNGLAVSPGWESRLLSLSLQRPNSIVNVSSDGKPLLWPHARQQYLSDITRQYKPHSSDIRTFHYFLSDPTTLGSVPKEVYGSSHKKISCFGNDYCLWLLSEHNTQAYKRSFRNYFSTQASDKWRCLNNSKLLTNLIRTYSY